MSNGKRLNYIDIAKGIAVLLVIFGHTFRESMRADFFWCDFSYMFVYRFHVSLLFVLSGMGYALTRERNLQKTAGNFFAKKAKTLLFPWVSYSLVIYAVFALMQQVPQVKHILEGSAYTLISPVDFFVRLLKNENPYCFHVWYLQTLFLFTAVCFAADKLLSKKTANFAKAAVIVLAPLVYEMLCQELCWTFKAFVQKIVFFLAGTMLCDKNLRKHAKKLVFCAPVCGLALAFMLVSDSVRRLYETKFVGIAVFYAENAVIFGLCIGIIALCVLLEKKLSLLATFGKNTMPYYLYHQPFCCAFLGILFYEKLKFSAPVTVTVCMAASIAIPFAVIKIIKKTKLKKFFEKVGLPV